MQLKAFHLFFIAVGCGIMATAASASAQNKDLMIKVKILFKVATYDSNLPEETVRVAVVYPERDSARGNSIYKTLKTLEKIKLKGRSLVVESLSYGSVSQLERQINNIDPYGLFVLSSNSTHIIKRLAAIAENRKLFSFSENPEHLKNGMQVSLDTEGGARRIMLNLKQAIKAERQFSSSLIKICQVIK